MKGKQVYLWHSLCTNKCVKCHAHKHMQKITMFWKTINGPINSFSFGYIGLPHKKYYFLLGFTRKFSVNF